MIVSHPDDVKQVFTGDPDVLHAGEGNAILRPLLGPRSVLLLDGPEHMRERKTLLPPFHGERMQTYGETIGSIAEAEVASWPVGEPIAIRPRMQALTLEVIMRAVFGSRDERLRELLGSLLDWLSDPAGDDAGRLRRAEADRARLRPYARTAGRGARTTSSPAAAPPTRRRARGHPLACSCRPPTWTTARCTTSC